ncbi:MAG: T9SS type A sorting domain-containing protein [Saprospiraceae bacterium]|nr:T9SS type A sorting domain-containing protein [Saprospiraceae bacterium]
MKKVIHLLCFYLLVSTLTAQSVVVNSPASIAGSYQFGTATAWGADLLSNIWTADAAMMMDDGANTGDGCDTVTNKSELAGKIVLVNRGTCNFSFKALQAQDWGGIGCIIINNVPNGGVAGMGAGTYGAQIRTDFPVVMISFEDGERIKAEMANGPVNISIGNIRFDHDVATNNRAGICHAPYGTYPGGWIRNAGDFSITPGSDVTNKGRNIETGGKVNAVIHFTPSGGSASELYNNSSDGSLVIEIDSTRSAFLPPFDLTGNVPGNSIGKGTVTYTVSSDQTDQSPFDNVAVSEFYLTSNIISKSRLQSNLRDPFATSSYRRSDGTNAEYLTGVRIPYGAGCKIDSILYFMTVSAPATLAGLTPEAILYGWDDADGDGNATNAEVSFLALGTFTFDAAETRSGAVVRIPLEDFNSGDPGYMIPADNMRFFVGVRFTGSELPFFGFDEGMDYNCNNLLMTNAGTMTDTELPYLGITGYDPNTGVPDFENAAFLFTGLRAGLSASLVMSGNCLVASKQLPDHEAQLSVFPTPTKDFLNVDVKLNETSSRLVYNIIDQSGRILYYELDESGSDVYQTRLDVQHLNAGQYHLQILTDKGLKQKTFTVIK